MSETTIRYLVFISGVVVGVMWVLMTRAWREYRKDMAKRKDTGD